MNENTGSGQGAAGHLSFDTSTASWADASALAALRRRATTLWICCAAAAVAALLALLCEATPWAFVAAAAVAAGLVFASLLGRHAMRLLDRLDQASHGHAAMSEQIARTEQAAGMAQRQAESAESSKRAFFAAASHELRTPLTGIIGVVDLLRAELPRTGRASYLLDVAGASSDALLTLVNDVLDLARIEAGRFDVTPADADLHDALRRSLEPLRLQANEQGLTLGFEWQAGLPHHWRVDARRVRQAVTNLVSNAIKFTETGSVSIAVSGRAHGEVSGEWELVIAVADTGADADAEAQARPFENPGQAEAGIVRRYGGTGLGLHVSRQLAQLMGGSLQLGSAPGGGSCFTMTLRVHPATMRAQPRDAHAPLSPHAVALHVLVADDNATNRFIITEHLQRWGHEVQCAEDGRRALDACAERRHDLVLLDGRMPRLNGLQVLERLRGRALDDALPCDREVFVAGISANTAAEDRAAFERASAQAFIAKPVELPMLHAVVQQAIDYQQRRGIGLAANERALRPMDRDAVERWLDENGATRDDDSDATSSGVLRAERMRGIFMRELPRHAARLHEARDAADLPALADVAHALKGASVYVDLPVLTQLAGRTEQQCLDGPRQAALASAAALQRCLDELAAAATPVECTP